MKTILSLIFALLLLIGCKTTEVVRYVPVEVPKVSVRVDSVLIATTDSIYIRERNDTVFYERWRTQYRDRVKIERDSVSVVVEIPVEVEVEKLVHVKVRDFFWWLGVVIPIILIIFVTLKLRQKFK